MSNKEEKKLIHNVPPGIGQPATRALLGAGYTSLEKLVNAKESELIALHGVGPKAIRILRDALEERGLSFKKTS